MHINKKKLTQDVLKHVLFTIVLFACISCKKRINAPDEPSTGKKDRTETELLKDSTYYYYKLYSYWEEYIPKHNNLAEYTDPLGSVENVLEKLKSTTPRFAPYSFTGGTYDRFSYFQFLDWGFTMSKAHLKMDKNNGYGLYFSFGAINDSTAYPFVNMVEGGSPASIAGIKRSDMIISLHDSLDMMVPVTCTSSGCQPTDPALYSKVSNALGNISYSNSVKIKLMHADSSINTYNLNYSTYEIDPLLADTVFEFQMHNVGYFAYSSFEQIEHGNKNQVNIDNLFNNFNVKNIKSLIVDLRYNGGGYVDAATYIANKIINTSGKDKLMLSYDLNDYLSVDKNSPKSSFKDVYFNKSSNLELETVCFIVSENTASASEMLINVLKPYMNVKIIAEQSNTYGKPVGYFETRIMNRISLWVTSFKLLNSLGESEYWTGIPADKPGITDYIFVDFGKKEELMISESLKTIGVIPTTLERQKMTTASDPVKIKINTFTTPPYKGALKQNPSTRKF